LGDVTSAYPLVEIEWVSLCVEYAGGEVTMATADNVITASNKLKGKWATRNRKFQDWYNIITLKNELEQAGMESVAGNDPRTGFNLGLHLLTSSIISHRIPSDDLSEDEIAAASYLERFISKHGWSRLENRYRRKGRQSWLRDMVALLLATGWYSVFAVPTDAELIAEVWHPADVFADFGDDELVECAHIYSISAAEANRKVKTMGWGIRGRINSSLNVYDHWRFDGDGDVVNAIVLGRELVKDYTKHTQLNRIPWFVSPVGGLPDRGSLSQGAKWQEHFGESLVATNEDLTLNYNKLLTFAQQLMRDTANPRWVEKSRGDTPILKEENMFKRGAIFRMTPEDDVGALQVPAIPVEIRTMLFDYQNMLQRGMFPWILFGNIQQQITGYAMSQIASAAIQTLTPYYLAIKGLLSDIDNFWLEGLLKNGNRPYRFEKPANFPEDVEFDVDFNLDIPGYTLQRITAARMVDPDFKLSTSTTMDKFFPEVKDPMGEQARARRDMAMSHPKSILVDQIIAVREQARRLREAEDVDSAELYEKLAKSLEAELGVADQPPTTATRANVPREAMPREAMEATEGMGEIV